jgi:hypothetical protein
MSDQAERFRQAVRVGCPFCWEWIPTPRNVMDVFSADGCLGGRCSCGAAFVVDETGRSGGQALLDAQALVCDGDLDAALALESRVDVEIVERGARRFGASSLKPKVWFAKLKKK